MKPAPPVTRILIATICLAAIADPCLAVNSSPCGTSASRGSAVLVRQNGLPPADRPVDARAPGRPSGCHDRARGVVFGDLVEHLGVGLSVQNPWAKPTGTKSWFQSRRSASPRHAARRSASRAAYRPPRRGRTAHHPHQLGLGERRQLEVQPAQVPAVPTASGCPGRTRPRSRPRQRAAAVGLREEAARVEEPIGYDQTDLGQRQRNDRNRHPSPLRPLKPSADLPTSTSMQAWHKRPRSPHPIKAGRPHRRMEMAWQLHALTLPGPNGMLSRGATHRRGWQRKLEYRCAMRRG